MTTSLVSQRQRDMNCELVEKHLSAYHDGEVDANTRTQIEAHLASCTHCDAILQDYVRFDAVLHDLPRVSPRPELRARIFSSPEFRAIVRGETTQTPSRPLTMPPPPPSRRTIPLMRVVSTVVAALVMIVGTGLIINTIAAHNRSVNAFIACPQISAPTLITHTATTLAGGKMRVVCDPHVQVGTLWQTSADGHWLAYINETTGSLRVVRGDATGDHTIDTGPGTIAAISWAPDSHRFVVIKQVAAARYSIWLARPETAAGTQYTSFTASKLGKGIVWSPDGNAVAWSSVQSDTSPAGITVLRLAPSSTAQTVFSDERTGSNIDLRDFGVTLTSQSPFHYVLTFAAGPTGSITSIETYGFDTTNGVAHAPYSVNDGVTAAFNSTTGKWAVAQRDGTVVVIDALTGKTTPLAHIDGVTRLTWSPRGSFVLATSGTTLWLVNSDGAQRLTNTLGALPPVWNGNGQVAFASDAGVTIYDTAGKGTSQMFAAPASGIAGLVWSPAGDELALWNTGSGEIIHINDQTVTTLTGPFTDAPQWISTR